MGIIAGLLVQNTLKYLLSFGQVGDLRGCTGIASVGWCGGCFAVAPQRGLL
jgi:hypothetical protein